jgi:transcription-repair coupling factor (superfamily II helicase)
VLSCPGIASAAQPFLGALLHHLFPHRPILVVAEGPRTQESFHQDITTWLNSLHTADRKPQGATETPGQQPPFGIREPPPSNLQPLFYPSWEILPHETKLPHVDVISERLETVVALTQNQSPVNGDQAPVIVTSVVALLQRTFPRKALQDHTRVFGRGSRIDPLDLVEWLEDQGYEPEAQVTQKGEISLRGGILDVFPLTSPWPVRLEFFGDELESLRHFDPLTQISREGIDSVTLPPAGELGLLKKVRGAGHESATSIQNPASPDSHPALGTLIEYLPAGAIIVLCEPELLAQRAEEYEKQIPQNDPFLVAWDDFQRQAVAKGITLLNVAETEPETLASDESGDAESGAAVSSQPALSMKHGENHRQPGGKPGIETPDSRNSALAAPGSMLPTPRFDGLDAYRPLLDHAPEPQVAEAQRREFFFQLHRWLRQGYAVHVFCTNDGERRRFGEIWNEYGLAPQPPVSHLPSGLCSPPSAICHPPSPAPGTGRPAPATGVQPRTSETGLQTHLATLARGFLYDEAKVVVVTDAEIFGRCTMQRPRRLKSPHAQATRSALDIDFTDLEEGDYVVHLQHGIGRYAGLQVLPIGAGAKPTKGTAADANAGQECLVIEYAPNDPAQPPPKLYVPVTEAHLVSKYVGTGKARPPLNTLGGTRWAKAKAQAERAVRDVAGELLSIQAARESQPGHSFRADTPWQREFEGAFLFEETPDQARAIVDTKADMERPKPMDRLICGDVGFGKTEVGIRAAFKAVMDGKQVAMLVPTTVLAQQHYNTFRERMADYPIRIELLSRFRTRREQQRVVKDLASGAVDIVIGTHRLLQPDIGFKELGLVLIDEEQRFGVMHKEKFKMLRKLIDVLTLSATPIPRTLYLALTGARDMSTIQTPPHDRLPVETVVTQYDERVIRDAIQRELSRGGQVFFLHNRVMTIQTMAQKLAVLAPHARIAVGHGQMNSDELEEVMTRFVNGQADILLSTTIIESGLDIPNANTIIIDRADRFGLSDLYQLRGRVGRYKHQAYAYLLLPRHGGLLTDVRKRMSAIKQYSTLGSGFKIAMRDLEIRGAGNLLGAEQSGHITAVGFDLYCQLLKQSVASLKGEKVKPRVEVLVRLDFLALSPLEEQSKISLGRPNSEIGNEAADDGNEVSDGAEQAALPHASRITHHAPQLTAAYIPFNYISDSRRRIEIYRKLAQATEKPALEALQKELRDRFGPLPPALELLLQVGEMKILAAERGVTAIEVREDKLMLTRNNDFIMVGSKFPRLTKKTTPARLKEIKRLLLSL